MRGAMPLFRSIVSNRPRRFMWMSHSPLSLLGVADVRELRIAHKLILEFPCVLLCARFYVSPDIDADGVSVRAPYDAIGVRCVIHCQPYMVVDTGGDCFCAY